jgi:DNA-binding beta-propeller fold protein YncE
LIKFLIISLTLSFQIKRMRRVFLSVFLLVAVIAVYMAGCKPKPKVTPAPIAAVTGNFPASIATIFINKCAIAGCHDAASAQFADGFMMDTWAHVFNGAYDGAMVVPYSTSYSPLLYYINTNLANGDTALPTMPISTTTKPLSVLSQAEYDTIKNWIAHGAPDVNGNVAFSTNPSTRQKLYSIQTGCNQLAVIDGQTKLVMRYIAVGDGTDAALHDVLCSSDGLYAYISFYAGNIVQKIDCTTDTVVATVSLASGLAGGVISGEGQWSIFSLSPDNSTLMVTAFQPTGYVAAINTASMQVIPNLSLGWAQGGNSNIRYPHGIAANAAFDTFYTTIEYGNEVVKWWYISGAPHFKTITVNSSTATNVTTYGVTPDPHFITMSPDYSKYFVTCENTDQVRVLSTATDKVIDSINVGAWPQEMAIDTINNYLFVACMLDRTNANGEGTVYVINYNTDAVVKILSGFFFEPHDIGVDEEDGLLYVLSTNLDTVAGEPPPHHSTACGVPGWYNVYNLSTLQPADNNIYYVLNDPYTITSRFK